MQTETAPRAAAPPRAKKRWSVRSVEVLAVLLVAAIAARGLLAGAMGTPRLQSWSTVFISIVIQAMPFVALGTLLSAAIAVFVPPAFFTRALPKNKMLAVPAAGIAGGILPGCECASVPVAGALVRRGVTPGAALAFLLSAPAINPVVMVSTYVAFPGQPSMVFARFGASLGAAVLMGWLWLRVGRDDWLRQPKHHDHAGKGKVMAFVAAARHDMTQAGGYLAIGAFAAATL
ncbi:permease, partial [Longispora fulva]